jgi:glycosyltransferase involved in cell wall biosynthesis
MKMKLSVVIPIYNEEKTLLKLLGKVESVRLPLIKGKEIEKEMILVDDCSKDRSREILADLEKKGKYKILYHKKNGGKGMALRTGFQHATGDIILIQDADLEYDPNDYPKLLAPILKGETKVVYGSRFKSNKGKLKEKRHMTYILHAVGNWGLTQMTNLLFWTKLTDMETCYKVFTKEVLKKVGKLRAQRFDFEPELTAKILKRGFKIKEVPIRYYSRDFDEGKKITWRDGLKAFWYIVKYRFVD